MSHDRNQEEWDLLRRQPDALLLRYQGIIGATVSSWVRRGFFSPDERDELVQEVNLALLERKLAQIARHYDGRVWLRTYFAKAVSNQCLELARRRARQPVFAPDTQLDMATSSDPTPDTWLVLRDECNRLEAILRLQPKAYRARLCLKAWARVILQWADVQFYDQPATQAALDRIRKQLFTDYAEQPDLEVFGLLVELLNLVEQKAAAPDSLRRWTTELAGKVVLALNGQPPLAAYTLDTLKELLRVNASLAATEETKISSKFSDSAGAERI